MEKEYWTVREVAAFFEVDEAFLKELEAEDILCPTCGEGVETRLFHHRELEKLRLTKILMEDLDVNLSGVEIILRMRQNMIEMRRQFDAILEDLRQQVEQRLL